MTARHKGSDIHAAAGHALITSGCGSKWEIDCPKCKYGTLVDKPKQSKDEECAMKCIDCKAIFTVAHLVELRVLPNPKVRHDPRDGANT